MVEQAIIVNAYGVLYYKQGEYEKAFLEYQRAMKLNPMYKEMISKEQDLDNLKNLEEFRKLIS